MVRLSADELSATRFVAQTRAKYKKALAPMLAVYPNCLDAPWRSVDVVQTYFAVNATRPPSFPFSTVETARAAVSAHHLAQRWPPAYFTEFEQYCRPVFQTQLKHCMTMVQRPTTGTVFTGENVQKLVTFWMSAPPRAHMVPRDCVRNAAMACLMFVGGARASEAEHCRFSDLVDRGVGKGFV